MSGPWPGEGRRGENCLVRHNPGLRNHAGEACLTLRGAARRLGISPQAVRWAMGAGHFSAEKDRLATGQVVCLIPVREVEAYRRRRAGRGRG